MPRLRALRIGEEQRRSDSDPARVPAPPAWQPEPFPLAGILPNPCLLAAPFTFPLRRGRPLWRAAAPDPGLSLAGSGYRAGPPVPLSHLEDAYVRRLGGVLQMEAARRMPRYAREVLMVADQARRAAECRRLAEQSRTGVAAIAYDDPFHTLEARRGAFTLYRKLPRCVLRSAVSGVSYRCAPTRLGITLTSLQPYNVLHLHCVRAGRGFRHPLVHALGYVRMDRCPADYDTLCRDGDLAHALMKHLNDARLTLEVGYENAPPPGGVLEPIAAAELDDWGPVYTYRHRRPGERRERW